MNKYDLVFPCPPNYDLYMTCHTHGWKNLAPFHWDDKFSSLMYVMSTNVLSVDIIVKQDNNIVRTRVISHKRLDNLTIKTLRESITRTLDIKTDTSKLLQTARNIDVNSSQLILRGAGRLLRSPSRWEDAAKTLFTTNCSWVLTQKISKKICSKYFVEASPSGQYPFPPPEAIAVHSPSEIKSMIPIGYRAPFLVSLAKSFSIGGSLYNLKVEDLHYAQARKLINALPGFGPYATNHMLIMLGFYNEIPVDSVVMSYLKGMSKIRNYDKYIQKKYGKWKDNKWWGLKLEKIHKKLNWLGE